MNIKEILKNHISEISVDKKNHIINVIDELSEPDCRRILDIINDQNTQYPFTISGIEKYNEPNSPKFSVQIQTGVSFLN